MSEDFDIYADLEHIESEAKKESRELIALKKQIHELETQLEATEQEKTNIIRKNGVLLENVSSLLLTAKAEIKRKDAVIGDLRRQCDNVAFGRKPHVNYVSKFTQTHVARTLNIGVQTPRDVCNDAGRSKSKQIDVVTESTPTRDRGRERERACKSQIAPEREQHHRRDRSCTTENDRHRDRERSHDRDRYRDSDNLRDREKYGERYRKRSQERTRHKERHSNERGNEKETHDGIRNKDLKHKEGRTRKDQHSYDGKYASIRSKTKEADEYDRFSREKQKYPEARDESSKVQRGQKIKDGNKPNSVISEPSRVQIQKPRTDSNDLGKSLADKAMASKVREFVSDAKEPSDRKRAINDFDGTASNESIQASEQIDAYSKVPKKLMFAERTKKNTVDGCTSMSQHDDMRTNADNCSDYDAIYGANETWPKHQQARDSNLATVPKIGLLKDNDRGDQNDVSQTQENQEEANERSHQSCTSPGATSLNFHTDQIPSTVYSKHNEPFSEEDRINTHCEKVNVSESGIVGDTISNEEDGMKRSKDIQSSEKVTHVLKKRKNKDQTEVESKSKPEPSATTTRKDVKQNELYHSEPTNNELIPTIHNNEDVVEHAEYVELRTGTGSEPSQTRKTQESPYLEVTMNKELACEGIADETHSKMVGNIEPTSQLPLAIDCVAKTPDEPTNPDYLATTGGAIETVSNDKQQNTLPTHESIASSDNNLKCYVLRDRRSNSCYSDAFDHMEHTPLETMSIQTYLMNFSVPDVENEEISPLEQSLAAHCVEPVSASEAAIASEVAASSEVEEANGVQTETVNEVQKKPKATTAEIIRERLRKRNNANVQKASQQSSTISLPVTPPKRRLSIDSASIASKRYNLHTKRPADGNKLSVSPSGKLSSTYFSQIALPITSALDSIPCRLVSSNIKQKAHDMHLTPMVVVHSPAKPSQETGQQVQNDYYSMPLDEHSSLKHIMDSLLQTPIKSESSDSVSPPCANDLPVNEGNVQNFASTNHESGVICSTPLSAKPLPRFPHDDVPPKPLSCKSASETEPKRTIKTVGARKEYNLPATLLTEPEGGASNINDIRDKHIEYTTESDATHSGQAKKRQRPKELLNKPTATHDGRLLNVNSKNKPLTIRKKANKMDVAPEAGKSLETDIAIVQQPSSTLSPTTSTSVKVPNSEVFKTPVAIPLSTRVRKKSVTLANNNDIVLVEKLRPKKRAREEPDANVHPLGKARKSVIIRSSDKRVAKDESHSTKPFGTTSSLTGSSKRSRTQKNDDVNQTGLTAVQSVGNVRLPATNGNDPLKKFANKKLATKQANAQHLGARSTASSNSECMEQSTPKTQTKPQVPANDRSAPDTRDNSRVIEADSQCIISNVTLNLSLADSASNKHSTRNQDAPVQYRREMRIVRESPSLMRIFITRK